MDLQKTGLKIWADAFYRQNAGFFILIGLLLVTVISGESLLLLADLAVNNFSLLAAGFFLPAILYGWKVLRWGIKVIRSEENYFFRSFLHLSGINQHKLLLQFQAALMAPMLPFAGLLILRSVHHHRPEVVGMMVLYFLFGAAFLNKMWMKALHQPHDSSPGKAAAFGNKAWLKGWLGWLLRHLLQHEPMLLFWSKLLSVVVIAGAFRLYHSDDYDERLLNLALLLAAFLHVGIAEEAGKLQHSLCFLRNLPFPFAARIRMQTSLLLPLLVPEVLFFFRNCPRTEDLSYRLAGPAFFISLVLFLTQSSYLSLAKPGIREKLFPMLFFGTSLAIMFSVPAALLSLMLFSMAIWLHHFFYFKAETSVPE